MTRHSGSLERNRGVIRTGDFEDYFTETEASREGYLWKYYDRYGRPRLTANPDTTAFRRDVFGHRYTIIAGFGCESK